MVTIYKKLGDRVRKIRKGKGVSQEELAEMAKIDPRSIVAIEQGDRNPTMKTINKLAKALSVHSSELLSF